MRPFRAEGALRFSYQGSKESGDLVLQAGDHGAYRLQLLAPITGAVLLDVGFDQNRLRVLDYGSKTRLEERNTPAVRQRLFGVDLTPEEFQVLFT
ncbi:MAG: hypothetical protein OEW39_14115, partial [Deltaproteobacteria bacterium]|nr:hypothetical protein [Deltaproteobacteria bacterium]